jgi:L-fuconolactonase
VDIVDAQVHANMLGTETAVAIMDALGIRGLVYDEFDGVDGAGRMRPGYPLSNGAFRNVGPSAESAALHHADRFVFLIRVDPRDPELEAWVATLKAAPGFRALRALVFAPEDRALFEAGGFDPLFVVARSQGLPVFVTCPGTVSHLAAYAERYPDVQIVIDHCGVVLGGPPGSATMNEALALARYPNVALKWAHAQSTLSTAPYPYPDLDATLRRAVDAFGAERVMWASDCTITRYRASWAESLFFLRHSRSLTEDEKAWILGRTVRTILNWPVPEPDDS